MDGVTDAGEFAIGDCFVVLFAPAAALKTFFECDS